MLCRWDGDAAACCRYWHSYSPHNPLQAWQSCELWCTVSSLPSCRCFWQDQHLLFLKTRLGAVNARCTGNCSWTGNKSRGEDCHNQTEKLTEFKAAFSHWVLDTQTQCQLLGRPVLAYVTWGFWLLQLSPCCLEEPVWKFGAPGWISRCSGERVKLGVSHVRNRNPTFSRPPWFFVSLGR